MFYSRPTLVPHTKKIVIGLPPKHVLNRFHPSWRPKRGPEAGPWVDPDPRQQMEQARNLAKYVFPRQYGLTNPFTSCKNGYLKGPCKTPKRLKDSIGTLEKMIWRHYKCRYKSLLDLACPSKVQSSLFLHHVPVC
ncbi:hypothetical protein C2E23DRAFT_872250 [Lenzites betulinus]|nr:hypothetical protein C2E23DRAFT_872250 [Lenzites betulinus]